MFVLFDFFFFFKQKTAYEMRISDWSSDVCSSDLGRSATGSPLSATGSRAPSALLPKRKRPSGVSRRTASRGSRVAVPVRRRSGGQLAGGMNFAVDTRLSGSRDRKSVV